MATLVTKPPSGNEWLHEIKFDGYRLLCYSTQKKVKLVTRRHQDWTSKFPHLQQYLKQLQLPDVVMDGEIVAFNEHQHSDFQILQNAIHQRDDRDFVYYVFDLIYYNELDLSKVALIDRKALLQSLIPDDTGMIRFSDHVMGHGPTVLKKACELGLEGIVSKQIYSRYVGSRTQSWLKSKCIKRQEFVIAGFTKPRGQRLNFGSLLLGYYEGNELHYCGHVGTGFTEASLKRIAGELQKHKTIRMPFVARPPNSKQVSWVEPVLIAEVEFSEWTRDGILRGPSFKGIRCDKAAKSIIREQLSTATDPLQKKEARAMPYTLSNPNRILYPDLGISKLELANFYDSIEEWALPYLSHRPLTLVRCPEGYKQNCFYQKHLNKNRPKSLFAIPIKEKHDTENYLYIKDKEGLLALVQLGVLEIHPWGARVDSVERPDMITFDLDPGINVNWLAVIQGARFVKKQLENLELKSFVKTTGGKGLHIVVPIKRLYTWEQVKAFSRAVVDLIVSLNPKAFIGTMSKEKRVGKIYLDYLRNQRGATAIGAYSTRAKAGAPVSTPLRWNELSERIRSDSFTVRNLLERLTRLKNDPWEDFFKTNQVLRGLEWE